MKKKRSYALGGTKNALLLFIFKVMEKGGNLYCTPSVDSMIKQLLIIHKINVKKSWAYECLAGLETLGLIHRRKRISQKPNGTINSKISMLSITINGLIHLKAKGVLNVQGMIVSIKRYLSGDDKRFPHPGKQDPKSDKPSSSSSFTQVGVVFPEIIKGGVS